jgi:AcrR family transcriptional regulator
MTKAQKPTQTRGPQQRGLKTRDAIVLAAIESLIDSNIYGLRFSAVSKLAKIPQPLMDYHFPSLESLILAMTNHAIEKLRNLSVEAIMKDVHIPRKALEGYVRAPFELAAKDKGFRAVWTSYYHLATVNKTFGDFNKTIRQTGTERIANLLLALLNHENRAQAKGALSIPELAASVQGCITGHSITATAETDGDFAGLAKLCNLAISAMIDINFPKRKTKN